MQIDRGIETNQGQKMTDITILKASEPMQELVLRSAELEDIDVVFGLFAEVQSMHESAHPKLFRKPVNDEKFEQFFAAIMNNPNQYVVLCCNSESTVGYIQYSLGTSPENLFQPEQTFAHIDQLVVTRIQRGQGYGTKLVEHVKDEAIRRGISQVQLSVWSFNQAAQACFSKAGFKQNVSCMYVDL